MGLKFRRQHPLGAYIADFYCDAHRLVIELDGGQHAQQIAYDAARAAWMQSQGIHTLRFWNHEVLLQTHAVLEQLRLWLLQHPTLTPAPLPRGEG
jgi:adenine-specific DNA-methyltransferase